MTYFFVIIGLSLINGLSNKKMSYVEILTLNTTVSLFVFYLDRYWNLQRLIPQEKIATKDFGTQDIIYNSLENIKPKQHNLLKDDLENSLGIEILKLDINEVDFEKQIVKIKSATRSKYENRRAYPKLISPHFTTLAGGLQC